MFTGIVGVYTGIKYGAFSVSENDRQPWRDAEALMKNVAMIFMGYSEISWVIRDALVKCDDFECALNYMSDTTIIAPGYIIMAGVKEYEGAIISRDRTGVSHTEMLTEDRWFLAQTNDDHFAGVCQTRCQTAKQNIKSLGREYINEQNLRESVMLANPNLNDITIFSSILNPRNNFFDTLPVDSDYPYVD